MYQNEKRKKLPVKLSVGIPIHNKELYLNECIDSILRQTFKDYELILWDDGSTDGSLDICKYYEKKYPDKVRVFSSSNRGVYHTRYSIIKQALGDYFFTIDADDYLTDIDCFTKVLKKIDTLEDSCVIVFEYEGLSIETDHLSKYDIIEKMLEGHWIPGLSNKIFRTELVNFDSEIVDGENLVIGEDFIFAMQILSVAVSVDVIHEKFYHYRQVPNSAIHSFDFKYLKSIKYIKKAIDDFIVVIEKKDTLSVKQMEKLEKLQQKYYLSFYTAIARKIKWTSWGKHVVRYLRGISYSGIFKEAYPAWRTLELKRIPVVWCLRYKLYFFLWIAFRWF